MRRPRIGWIPSSPRADVASVRLRSLIPLRYLRAAGWDCELLDPADPFGYDLVVFQKAYDEERVALAHDLRRRGIRTMFDLCDNHFYNPDDLPALAERAA